MSPKPKLWKMREGGGKRSLAYSYVIPRGTDTGKLERHITRLKGSVRKISLADRTPASPLLATAYGGWGREFWHVSDISAQQEVGIRRKFPEIRLAPPHFDEQEPEDRIKIEIASLKDLNELHAIEKKCFEPGAQASKKQLQTRLALGTVYKAVGGKARKKCIVGFLFTSTGKMAPEMLESRTARIRKPPLFSDWHHFIDLASLKIGAGKALVRHAIRQARAARATKIYLHAVPPRSRQKAKALFNYYERLGFVLDEKTFDPKAGTRFYWMPIATGLDEIQRKREHGEAKQALKAIATFPKARRKDIDKVMELLAAKHPWISMLENAEQKAAAAGRILVQEALYSLRKPAKPPLQVELFREERGLYAPGGFEKSQVAARMVNAARSYYRLPELSASQVARRFLGARMGNRLQAQT